MTDSPLVEAMWGRAVHLERRTVDVHVHVRHPRQALKGDGDREVDMIRTEHSAGYAFSSQTRCRTTAAPILENSERIHLPEFQPEICVD